MAQAVVKIRGMVRVEKVAQLMGRHIFKVFRRCQYQGGIESDGLFPGHTASPAAFHAAGPERRKGHAHGAERAKGILGDKLGGPETTERACSEWFDVRAFGQLFAIKAGKKAKKGEANDEAAGDTGISIGIRGPVSIQSAFSLSPVSVTSTQITKSVSGEGDGSKRGSDTMGMKHRVDHGVYASYGSMNPQLADRTGFSDADAEAIKAILPRLFENDASSARPDGSMQILSVVWWKHNCKAGQHSAAKVHGSLQNLLNREDGSFDKDALRQALPGLEPEIIDGF